jgi:nucleotide-binding universal stress UspA family protein
MAEGRIVMTRPVILAYDGSRDARHAIEAAGELFQGPAVVAYVYPVPQPIPAAVPGAGMIVPVEMDATVAEEIEGQARRQAAAVVREGLDLARAAGFEPEPELLCGGGAHAVWNCLVSLAEARDARAIVVGHHEMSWLEEKLHGQVCAGLVKHASRPVLVIPAPPQ